MADTRCPKCDSSDVVPRTVNDRLRAADPRGQTFEVALQLQVWCCRSCRLCWRGQEAVAGVEAAYQNALNERKPSRVAV
jgi:ribosomal protein L37AE/L43A